MVLRLPAAPSSVPPSRAAVMEWCDRVKGHRDADVALAVTEVVANVVQHAYPQGGGEFEVRAHTQGDELSLAVRDWGAGRHAPSRNRGIGIGLRIIYKLARRAVVEDCEQGTLVSMWFSGRRLAAL